MKQGQPPRGFRNVLAGLPEALDRFDLLLDAELHHADVGARGVLIRCHSFARICRVQSGNLAVAKMNVR